MRIHAYACLYCGVEHVGETPDEWALIKRDYPDEDDDGHWWDWLCVCGECREWHDVEDAERLCGVKEQRELF